MISLFQSMTMSIGAQIWKAVDAGDKANVTKLVKRASGNDFRYEHQYKYWLMTALELASWKDDTEMVQMLVQAGANVNDQDSENGYTALMWAALKGHLEVVRVLLEWGADKNLQNKDGRTALIWAADKGHLEVVRLLLESGADKNLQNNEGKTALMWAANGGHLEVVRLLLEWGADKNLLAKYGWTALMSAAVEGHLEVVKLLLDWGADKNLQWKGGKGTAADLAKSEKIRTLIKTHVFSGTLPAPKYRTSTTATEAADQKTRKEADQIGRESASLSSTSLSNQEQTDPGVSTQAASPVITTAASSSAISNPVAFVEQDRQALTVFLQTAPRLKQTLLTVAAHDRALQVLVSKEKECPSLFWFYPKKPELRRWLSDPAKCLFQDSLMMVVVCPVTLCVVPCGPEGVGWEVSKPKKWVKDWGPAILFSIYVLQAAVVAGRVVGIPIPPVPGGSEVKEALGLKGMLSRAVSELGVDQINLSDSLNAFSEAIQTALDLNPELQALCEGLRAPRAAAIDQALPAHLPMRLVGDAYKSIHTFLTTGENAKLGKLEDQLRGRMERVMAPDGDIEWVSVEGKSAWLQKHSAVVSSMPQQQSSLKAGAIAVTAASAAPAPSAPRSWLAVRLIARGIDEEILLSRLDDILVAQSGEGFTTEESFATLPVEEVTLNYLKGLNITARGTANHIVALHRELHAQYQLPSTSSPPLAPGGSDGETAALTAAEKDELLSNMQTMKKELEKLRAATASTSTSTAAAAQKAPGGQGGRVGLILQQVQCNIRNPRTNQPYTMDELAAELLRHEKQIAQCEEGVAGATAAVERMGELNDHAPPAPRAPSTRPASEEAEKKRLLFGK